MVIEAIVIVLLVALSAIFSGMESALFSISEVKLRSREEEGNGLPKMLRLWLEEPNQVLATLLIGNNLANITASALATHLATVALAGTAITGAAAISIAVGAMTLLILVGGEVVPKTVAKHHPEQYLVFLPVITFSHFLFRPPAKVLVSVTESLISFFGGSIQGEGSVVTEEAIENMVRIGKADGSIAPEDARLLTGVLELDEKIAREVMVPRTDVVAIDIESRLEDVIKIILDAGCSRYPVYEGNLDKIVGLLYAKDLLVAATSSSELKALSLKDLLRPPLLRPANIGLQRLLLEMKRERVHMTMLISEFGGIEGLVTLEDIVEEVFGPIYDEHDGEAAIRTDTENVWTLSGVCTLDDLEDQVGLALDEDDDYTTVAGLLMKVAGRLPHPGYTYSISNWKFEVLDSDETTVHEIRLVRTEEASESTPEKSAGPAEKEDDSLPLEASG
jgi:putative hemolysin